MPRSAYGFSKLAGEVWCRAAHDEHGLPYTICRPFNAYGPGEMPDDEPGIAHAVPDLIRKVALRPAAAADLRRRDADAHADARRRHRRRRRRRDGLAGRPARGLQHLRVRRADGRRDRARSSGRSAVATPTPSSSSTCRRSPSTSCAAGRASRRPHACSAGRRRSACARASRRPPTGCAACSLLQRNPLDERVGRERLAVLRVAAHLRLRAEVDLVARRAAGRAIVAVQAPLRATLTVPTTTPREALVALAVAGRRARRSARAGARAAWSRGRRSSRASRRGGSPRSRSYGERISGSASASCAGGPGSARRWCRGRERQATGTFVWHRYRRVGDVIPPTRLRGVRT